MEVELESFHLIDHTPVCGVHNKNFTARFGEKRGMKFTLLTTQPRGILVERAKHEPCLVPIGWVTVFTPLPGKTLRAPNGAPAKRPVRRTKSATSATKNS